MKFSGHSFWEAKTLNSFLVKGSDICIQDYCEVDGFSIIGFDSSPKDNGFHEIDKKEYFKDEKNPTHEGKARFIKTMRNFWVPNVDINGNPHQGTRDVGAYEAQ